MRPKYQKQTRQARKEKQGSDSSETESKTCPEPRNKEYLQEPSSYAGTDYDETNSKPKRTQKNNDNTQKDDRRHSNKQKHKNGGNSHTVSGRHNEQLADGGQDRDEKKRNKVSPFTYAETDALCEKRHKKKRQETLEEEETFTKGSNDDKLSYQSDNTQSVTDKSRSTCNIEKRRDTTISRRNKTRQIVNNSTNDKIRNKAESQLPSFDKVHSTKLEKQSSPVLDTFDADDVTFDVDDVDIETVEDERREYNDLSSQPRGSERNKELYSRISRTSSTDLQHKLVSDIYRTLVRMKGENLSLTELADVMAKQARIPIDYNNFEDLTSLFKQNEDKFVIAYWNDEPLISVKTEVAICSIFTNDPCRQHGCQDLHICKYFLLSKCSRKECKFGHNLSNKHNKTVLRAYSLDGIEKDCKMSLIRNVDSRNISTMPLICKFYNNEGGCKNKTKCTHLHICKNFIYGDCKFGKRCIRCHNILSKQSLSVLERHGLKPNSYNYNKIINLLKDTLDEGEVLLKRDIQPNRGVGTSRKQQTISSDDTSGDESNTSTGNYSSSGTSTGSDLNLSESEHVGYESASENTGQENIQTTNNVLGNEQALQEVDIQCSNGTGCNRGYFDASDNDRHGFPSRRRNKIKPVMTFDSQIENKQFRIRAVKGSWEITNKQGIWIHMDTDESDRLSKLHNDFIRVAENIVANSTV